MKNRLSLVILLMMLLLVSGCEQKSADVKTATEVGNEVYGIKPTIPFKDRRFIYKNGIEIMNKEAKPMDEKGAKVSLYYPAISGLKNKETENKINNEIKTAAENILSQAEVRFKIMNMADSLKVTDQSSRGYITYNFNNVIFIEYFANINGEVKGGMSYFPGCKTASYGCDLNTGERISLDDLFKPGCDYRTKINNFICQYLIENNYDDYETERMTKPFQGIRENQSFSFGLEGLRIILDEKNDEFVDCGYPDQIFIPLDYFGDDLYIFDKYFDENENIYEVSKRSKKLFPNQLEFRANNVIEDINEKYNISITQGKFWDVPNKDIQNKLNEMVISKFDAEDFKERAKTLTKGDGVPLFNHYINLFMNAGGYLSMAVSDDIYYGKSFELKRTPFNYNFNRDKEMHFEDIFAEGYDAAPVIKNYIMNLNYPVTEEMVEKGTEEALKTDSFNFEETGIAIYFSPEGASLDNYQKWVWIPFDEFGLENIKFLQ